MSISVFPKPEMQPKIVPNSTQPKDIHLQFPFLNMNSICDFYHYKRITVESVNSELQLSVQLVKAER